MKKSLLLLVLPLVIACSTVKRPDLGVVKHAGKKHEHVQTMLLGVVPWGSPKLKPIPSSLSETKQAIRKPAQWLLWVALPGSILIAVLGAVAVVYLQNPRLAKLAAVVSISLFLAAILSTTWLLATTSMTLFVCLVAVVLAGVIVFLYRLTRGTTPGKLRQVIDSLHS